MRVVHECSGALRYEFVHVGLTRFDRGLIEPGHTVHAVRQPLSVPVNAGVLGQSIGDEYSHPISLDSFDGRPG